MAYIESVWNAIYAVGAFLKESSDAIQSVATICAVAFGAWWWLCKRERKPIAKIDLDLKCVNLENGSFLFRIETRIENIGKVLLRTGNMQVYVQQIVPIPEVEGAPFTFVRTESLAEYNWPCVIIGNIQAENSFEPGQDGILSYEATLESLPKTVLVRVTIENPSIKDKLGWWTTKLVHL
jgi:hypothetical protein